MGKMNKPTPPRPPSFAYFSMYLILYGQAGGVWFRIPLSLN